MDGDGVNDGLRSLLAADVPSSAEAPGEEETAEAPGEEETPEEAEATGAAEAAGSAVEPDEPDEPVGRALALPIVSAGNGIMVLDPLSALSSVSASAAGVSAAPEESPLPSPSGSAFRLGGARMIRPASSTPSSSVLTGAPMYLFVDTIREPRNLQTLVPRG